MKTQFIDLVQFGGAHEGSRADYYPVFSLDKSMPEFCQ